MDLKEVKRVIQLVEEAQISSLKLEVEGMKIEVSKEFSVSHAPVNHGQHVVTVAHHSQAPATAPPVQSAATPAPVETPAVDANSVVITSPMVGTFYASPNPDSPPFVKAGDVIKKGSVVCIIEAMKLFNEIESDVDGVVEKVFVESATPVEYGQNLFLIRKG